MIKFQSFLSSSAGNATFVTDDTVHLLVDCGAGCNYITECLRRIGVAPESLSGILITHEHRDHIAGAGIFSRKYNIPVYATEKTWAAMENIVGNILPKNRRLTENSLQFGNLTVNSFSIPHDAADPVGYSFISENEKFTIATDLGHITDELLKNLSGSTSVIIEANHDVEMLKTGPYPYFLKQRILGDRGHLSNALCGKLCALLAKTGTKAFWLGHLSEKNNEPMLAYHTVLNAMEEESIRLDDGLSLNVLPMHWIA